MRTVVEVVKLRRASYIYVYVRVFLPWHSSTVHRALTTKTSTNELRHRFFRNLKKFGSQFWRIVEEGRGRGGDGTGVSALFRWQEKSTPTSMDINLPRKWSGAIFSGLLAGETGPLHYREHHDPAKVFNW